MTTFDDMEQAAIEESTTCAANDHLPSVTEQREKIAQKEQKAVSCLRLVLLAVLVVSAIVVSVVLYLYTSAKETNEFESQFESDSFKVFESLGLHLDLTLGAADSFVFKMISYAKASSNQFPFVTIPDFGVQAAKVLSSSAFFYMGTYIKVANDERVDWENYTSDATNTYWLEENIQQVQVDDPNYHGPIVDDEYSTSNFLFNYNDEFLPEVVPYNDTSNYYLPSFQHYPSVPDPYYPPYNWNAMGYPDYAVPFTHAMHTKTVTMTGVVNQAFDPNDEYQVYNAELLSAWAENYISTEEDPTEPYFELIYPMLNAVDKVQIDTSTVEPAVGVLSFAYYVRDLVRDILPPNSKGIVVVFQNTCDQVFTYQVDGAETTYMGIGDHHDPKYSHMGRTARLPDLSGQVAKVYTGLPLDTESCVYSVTVYPSQAMQDRYVTSKPIFLAVGAFVIFLFTSAVFLLYDLYVARRQQIVKHRAEASGAIVNSLFPEQVRNQLYEEHQPAQEHQQQPKTKLSSAAAGASDLTADSSTTTLSPTAGKPIADLFDSTSVFFADIVGFTSWSSSRTPIEVFELLEALYGAFDVIAKRRRVFKVETIGDCYVAVTGIPNPQADHAVIMVKFARDCLTRMRQVLQDLVGTLGAATLDLDMRAGVHSGPVTAGVLRGEKGRFQLFGDTVNTAARMESNGKAGMIHVSQATADELTKAGKSSWLKLRDEKITAKGKGEMQTYFVMMSPARTSIASTSGEAMALHSIDEPPAGNNAQVLDSINQGDEVYDEGMAESAVSSDDEALEPATVEV
ncbi:Receptor-type guanylate cyclase gcy [Seminavis robusta]|uniref:Receptor-type guanylate cyclase gcy n=1 Tax=Seminavis robusta TaxID=568900 RepID=A0A9N8HS20_9STRA|nr:Receptor-type guanylate cyclase gcy [Seminavis robusta]|eukprot:Sro1656_g289030.1 Receptor-type guanylate cyclase gcy (795) ;mRNA; f:13510-16231